MATEAKAGTDETIVREFKHHVNMSARALETWLQTDESKSVGVKSGASTEATGHQSGRHIVKLLREKKSDYDESDYQEMHRVVGYIKRHLAQRPSGDVSETRWAYSLKNWGHDPTKR